MLKRTQGGTGSQHLGPRGAPSSSPRSAPRCGDYVDASQARFSRAVLLSVDGRAAGGPLPRFVPWLLLLIRPGGREQAQHFIGATDTARRALGLAALHLPLSHGT